MWFDKEEDYVAYAKHPKHVGVIESHIKPFLEKTSHIQFKTVQSGKEKGGVNCTENAGEEGGFWNYNASVAAFVVLPFLSSVVFGM